MIISDEQCSWFFQNSLNQCTWKQGLKCTSTCKKQVGQRGKSITWKYFPVQTSVSLSYNFVDLMMVIISYYVNIKYIMLGSKMLCIDWIYYIITVTVVTNAFIAHQITLSLPLTPCLLCSPLVGNDFWCILMTLQFTTSSLVSVCWLLVTWRVKSHGQGFRV